MAALQRLQFLDVMKGAVMLLLAAESCQVFASLYNYPLTGAGAFFIRQFYHHPWHGLHAWDLVQPSFMFVAGTALYLSYTSRLAKGISWKNNLRQVLVRSFRLFLLGIVVLSVQSGKMVWELYNVLTQLAFTLLVAYCIINKPVLFQLIFSLMLLLITECCYRFILMPGYDQPFTIHQNFGSWVDMVITGKINADGWVTFNCVPTSAHTIWGVCAGKLLLSGHSKNRVLKIFILAGATGLITGYAMDWLNISPIIKRICTSSFIIVSGGWVLLILSFTFWLVDLKGKNRLAWLLVPMGMNAIFIYMFFETAGYQWLNPAVEIFVGGVLEWVHVPVNVQKLIAALATLSAEWYLCYWLYRRKIFIKA